MGFETKRINGITVSSSKSKMTSAGRVSVRVTFCSGMDVTEPTLQRNVSTTLSLLQIVYTNSISYIHYPKYNKAMPIHHFQEAIPSLHNPSDTKSSKVRSCHKDRREKFLTQLPGNLIREGIPWIIPGGTNQRVQHGS